VASGAPLGVTTAVGGADVASLLAAGNLSAGGWLGFDTTTASRTVGGNLTLTGDLTVNGTTTTVNSTTIDVADKNITLGNVASPTDVTADGGGITLRGSTNKTLAWIDATDAWTSSENVNLASGKAFYVNGTMVLSGTNLDNVTVDGGTF
jgi:hypothetical protein